MKKLILTAAMIAATFMAFADQPVSKAELPQAARQFINTYYPKSDVAFATLDTDLLSKSYDVVFTGGDKVEFDGNGEWTDIKSVQGNIPSELVPTTILQYVTTNFANEKMTKLERSAAGYEVELSNGIELKFNRDLKLVDIDD